MFAAGRRKSSVARVRLMLKETGVMTVNGKPLDKYFTHQTYRRIVQEPLVHTNTGDLGVISVKVQGGGPRGQADSIRLGISRVLLKHDESLRPLLKSKKLLSVDSRVKERKKYGLKKARRAPQWQKR
ncbi:MAG: 30S ribosomal protein S9 [Patescibacteria group bacterium]